MPRLSVTVPITSPIRIIALVSGGTSLRTRAPAANSLVLVGRRPLRRPCPTLHSRTHDNRLRKTSGHSCDAWRQNCTAICFSRRTEHCGVGHQQVGADAGPRRQSWPHSLPAPPAPPRNGWPGRALRPCDRLPAIPRSSLATVGLPSGRRRPSGSRTAARRPGRLRRPARRPAGRIKRSRGHQHQSPVVGLARCGRRAEDQGDLSPPQLVADRRRDNRRDGTTSCRMPASRPFKPARLTTRWVTISWPSPTLCRERPPWRSRVPPRR